MEVHIPSNPRWGRLEIASLAIEAALAPVVAGVIGYLIDRKFGWSPWGLLIGLGLGGLAAARMIGLISRQLEREDEQNDRS